jgi:hypothetical protein
MLICGAVTCSVSAAVSGMPSREMREPISEIIWPIQSLRKSELRRGPCAFSFLFGLLFRRRLGLDEGELELALGGIDALEEDVDALADSVLAAGSGADDFSDILVIDEVISG